MASRHPPSSSASTTSSLQEPVLPVWVFFPSTGDNWQVPAHRGLIQSEECLEHLVPRQLPQLRKELQLLNSKGRSALEDGDWERAESSFLQCRSQLRLAAESLEKHVFGFLLAWIDTPLAQLYQGRGTVDTMTLSMRVDMLYKAMVLRGEMLDCVRPLRDGIVGTCLSYFSTALYELGELKGSPDIKSEAVRQYPGNEGEAEAHICVLLWCDHYFSGNLEVSLRWIQKANRLWKGNTRSWECIRIEAGLYMKLKMISEAIKVLEGSKRHISRDYHQEIHELLALCYLQMSKTAESNANWDQAELLKAQALSYSDVPSGADENEKKLVESHPLMMRTPLPIGSGLGLVQQASLEILGPEFSAQDRLLGLIEADMGIPSHRAHCCMNAHLSQLPRPVHKFFFMNVFNARDAHVRRDWEAAICFYQRFRTYLKMTKRTINSKTYDWLLAWVDVVLADLYQYRVGKLEEAVEIWKELNDCAIHLMPSEEDSSLWGYNLNLDLAEFEWKQASGSGEHVEIIQRRARCSKYPLLELYFWLYLHHHIRGNYKCSLRWLQEIKKRKEKDCPDQEWAQSRPENYFCCEYTLLRCEADLWMKLQATEEATRTLKDMLTSRQCHVHQGSQRRLAQEAKQWLRTCGSGPSAVEDDCMNDEHAQDEILDDSPSPTGCSCLYDGPGERIQELIQSTTGLEHHLRKLPVPIQMAFRTHSDLGRSSMNIADWGAAVFNYEWCKELLRLSMRTHVFEKKTYDWLMVWLDVPLVEVYEFRKMEYLKVLDLRTEMWSKVPADLPDVRNILKTLEVVALYQCAVSDYPEVKDEVLKHVSEVLDVDSNWSTEKCCILHLHRRNFKYGNLEASSRYIDRLIQHVALADDEEKEYLEERLWYLEERLCTLLKLGKFGDAEALIEDFLRRTNKSKSDLPGPLRYILAVCQRQDTRIFDQNVRNDCLEHDQYIHDTLRASPLADCKRILELEQRRQEVQALWDKEEREKAVELYERYLEEIQPGWHPMKVHDYVRLGFMHLVIWRKNGSPCGENIQNLQEDKNSNFSRAVLYFEKCTKLPSHQRECLQMVLANYALVTLYAEVDHKYYSELCSTTTHLQLHASLSSIHGSSSSSDKQASDAEVIKAMREYLAFPNNMVYYGKVASGYVTGPLYTMSNQRSVEAWIATLEQVHDMYIRIRTYFYRRVLIATQLRSLGDLGQGVEEDTWATLLYTERERSRVMLYQTGPEMLNYSASRKLWSFDVHDSVAGAAIRRDCATLLQGGALFVQYSNLTFGDILISVLDQKGNLTLSRTSRFLKVERKGVAETWTVEDRLKKLYTLLGRKRPGKLDHDRVNKELEFLYDVLIQPITGHLQKMKPEQKLLISTNQGLTKVPFAALRDRRTGKFLIERHTIASTSSLRALKVCSERLDELQSPPANISLGSVVALGDPSYEVCQKCNPLKPLEGTAKEVEHIANLFGETVVVKLLRERATAEQLGDWTVRPNRENIRQALVHIGSHAKASDNSRDPKQNVLHLACPYAPFDDPTTVTTQRPLSIEQGRGHLEQEADEYNHEEVSNFDDEFEATTDESSDEEVTDFEEDSETIMRKFERMYVSEYCNTGQSLGKSTGNLVSDQEVSGTSRIGSECSAANDKAHDLKAEDIRSSDPKWKAELVVLSACSTSRGRQTAVEGVLSLARAFLIAGVPCTVTSLWEVDDTATVALMATFYEELWKGNDVASALRCAMLRGLHEHQVKDWAPFVVSGVPTLRIPQALQRHA